MLALYTLFESKLNLRNTNQTFHVPVNNPKDLLNWMDKIHYGWMDKNFKKYYSFDNWFNNVIIHLPKDVFKHKIGTCYEQTLFAFHVFQNQFPIYPLKMFHVQQYYVSNHSFLMFKKNNNWFHFEHSFNIYKGIHGPFKFPEQALVKLKKTMIRQSKQDGTYLNEGFEVHELKNINFKKALTGLQFYKKVNYNWNKSEK